MNNRNVIKLINENGVAKEYGEIPDLWHIAEGIRTQLGGKAADEILQVWQMAHDLKSVVEGQGEAKLVEPKTMIGVPDQLAGDLSYVIELASHRADMWRDHANGVGIHERLGEFYECDDDELESMADSTESAVRRVSAWFKGLRA